MFFVFQWDMVMFGIGLLTPAKKVPGHDENCAANTGRS